MQARGVLSKVDGIERQRWGQVSAGMLRGLIPVWGAGGACGPSVGGGGLADAGGAACERAALGWPKLGLRAWQAATSCGSIGGKGLLAFGRCGVPRMIGATQSAIRPLPSLAPPRTKPASWQAAVMSTQGRWRGADSAVTAVAKVAPAKQRIATIDVLRIVVPPDVTNSDTMIASKGCVPASAVRAA
jgi:hypothetical protein